MGRIAEGHDRRTASIEIKRRKMPISDNILLDTDGEWLVPTLDGIDSKTEAEAGDFRILPPGHDQVDRL